MADTTPATPEPTTVDAEVRAMEIAYTALAALDRAAQHRAMRWLDGRLSADARHDAADDEEPF